MADSPYIKEGMTAKTLQNILDSFSIIMAEGSAFNENQDKSTLEGFTIAGVCHDTNEDSATFFWTEEGENRNEMTAYFSKKDLDNAKIAGNTIQVGGIKFSMFEMNPTSEERLTRLANK